MATAQGTVDQGLDDAMSATRRIAASEGYTLAEAESGPNVLVFKKGVSILSFRCGVADTDTCEGRHSDLCCLRIRTRHARRGGHA
jgi:hypothetical protein